MTDYEKSKILSGKSAKILQNVYSDKESQKIYDNIIYPELKPLLENLGYKHKENLFLVNPNANLSEGGRHLKNLDTKKEEIAVFEDLNDTLRKLDKGKPLTEEDNARIAKYNNALLHELLHTDKIGTGRLYSFLNPPSKERLPASEANKISTPTIFPANLQERIGAVDGSERSLLGNSDLYKDQMADRAAKYKSYTEPLYGKGAEYSEGAPNSVTKDRPVSKLDQPNNVKAVFLDLLQAGVPFESVKPAYDRILSDLPLIFSSKPTK